MSDSCFVTKFSHFLDLTEGEKTALAVFEEDSKHYRAGQVVTEEGDGADRLYTVKSGWLHASNALANGTRQILQIYYPGDVAGMPSIAFANASATIVCGTDSELCRLPKKALGKIFEEHPRLSALFYSLGMLENVTLSDRLKCLGRCTGEGKLAGLILEIYFRLRVTNSDIDRSFEMKLTQTDIGDAIGVTNVHVSRLFGKMESRNLIRREGRTLHILELETLVDEAFFTDRFTGLDTSWYPDPR